MKKQYFFVLSVCIVTCSISTPIIANTSDLQADYIKEIDSKNLFSQAMKLKTNNNLPDAEKAFMAVVKQEPNNVLALIQLATVQSWQNKYDLAIKHFKQVLTIDPHYTAARIGLARVSYWQGKRTLALTEIERVLNEQPKEPSNWILKGDILMADTKPTEARNAYLHAQSLMGGPVDTNLSKKIDQAKTPNRWRLDAGFISDNYSAHRVDGHSSYLQLGHSFVNKTTVYLRGEEYSSFDKTDTGVVVGAYFSPIEMLLIHAEYYANNNQSHFRPENQFSINTDLLFNNIWQPLLSFRQASYNVNGASKGHVNTITSGLRINYDITSLELRHARSTNTDNTTTSTNTLKLNLNYKSIAPYIFYTIGQEGIPPLAVADITVIGAGAVLKINNSIGLRVDISREDRKDTYIYNALGAGISLHF